MASSQQEQPQQQPAFITSIEPSSIYSQAIPLSFESDLTSISYDNLQQQQNTIDNGEFGFTPRTLLGSQDRASFATINGRRAVCA